MLQYYILRRAQLIICLTRCNWATIGSRNRFPRSPLEPAEKHVHTQQWRYIHRCWLRRSQMISVHVNCLHSRSPDWFVPFPSSVLLHSLKFRHFWTAMWQQWMLDWWKRTFCGSFWLRQRCGLKPGYIEFGVVWIDSTIVVCIHSAIL